MSGFFGIFNRNGKAIDKKIANNMMKVMSSWDSDESALWVDDSVALGHAMLWNTPESKYEHLPLQKDIYVLTMDARIDNRDELVKEVKLPDRPMSEIGDSEFILAAYQKWGEECPKYLLGDFAFVIWDEEKQQLFCTRDHIGIKQFYYYLDDEKFVFSNDIKVLLAYGKIDNIINENAVAYYLRYNYLVERDSTFFENVHKLHAATNIIIMANNERKDTYWKAEDCPQIRYKSLNEYIQVARELLKKSVDARIRSAYPIASHLSGGLDSSSVAVLASRKLAQSGRQLTGFNWIPVLDDHANKDYYEWGNSKKISLLENIEHLAIDLSEDDVLDIYKTLDIAHGDILHFWYEPKIQKYASKKGIRVILSGTGGDEFISNEGLGPNIRVSWMKKFKQVHQALVDDSSGLKELFFLYTKRVYSYSLHRIFPNRIFCIFNGINCGFSRAFSYLQPSISKLIKKQEIDNIFLKKDSVRKNMLDELNSGSMEIRPDSWNASGKLYKLEYRFPLLDKRLIEFALGIPENLFYQNGIKRYLFKRTVEELLPQEIISADTKYEPKRVEKYMAITKKAQGKWKKSYNYKDKSSKYIKIDTLFKEIDQCVSTGDNNINNNIIIAITNAILIIESSLEGKKENEKVK